MTASPVPQRSSVTESAHPTGPVYFIADAHLGIESESLEKAKERDLVAFLSHLAGRASLLYLVGDTFDFWFEYPRVRPTQHSAVLTALTELVDSGTPVRFLGGNHDYWAGHGFEEMTGANVHLTHVSDTHFGRRTFVAHGDGLPEGDWKYRVLKAVIRSLPAIAAFRLIPPARGVRIARWASGLSEITPERIRRATPAMRDFLERKLAEGYDVAVVGHVHKQIVWKSGGGTAVVVGDWMKHRSVVELTKDGVRPLSWVGGALREEPLESAPEA
ncbi:MAG: UDP-2,3-diacylglucosamine diphosphatase [Candidatus Eisenbacteria bacterium]